MQLIILNSAKTSHYESQKINQSNPFIDNSTQLDVYAVETK